MTDAIVWAEPERASFLRHVTDAAGLRVVAAGGPSRARAGATAHAFEAAPAEDLRAALTTGEAGVIVIADAGAFGASESGSDAEAVLAAAARGALVLCFDPVPASALELSGAGWLKTRNARRPVDGLRFVPGASDHPVLGGLDDVLAAFGAVRVASVRAMNRAEHGSLSAALFGGLALLRRVIDTPELIDTAVVTRGAGERLATDSRLRELQGHAVAMARTAGGSVGRLLASDTADAWERSLELFGPAGRLVIRDAGFAWHDAEGTLVDSGERVVPGDGDAAVAALADAIRRRVEQFEPAAAELTETLTLASAALLSARTGQPESPAAIARAGVL